MYDDVKWRQMSDENFESVVLDILLFQFNKKAQPAVYETILNQHYHHRLYIRGPDLLCKKQVCDAAYVGTRRPLNFFRVVDEMSILILVSFRHYYYTFTF